MVKNQLAGSSPDPGIGIGSLALRTEGMSMTSFIYLLFDFTAQVLACLRLLHKVCLKWWRKEKKSMTGPMNLQPSD